MDINSTIRQLFKKAIAGEQIYCVPGEVISVDTTARTCEVQPQQSMATIPAARIQAIESGTLGVCLFPKVGSQVVVAFIDRAQAVIVATDQIDNGEITMGDLTVSLNDFNLTMAELTANTDNVNFTSDNVTWDMNSGAINTTSGFDFDGGINGGLVIIAALVTQLNALVAAINANVAIFNAHVHAPPVPGPPIPTTPETPVPTFNPIPWTNTKVNH